jgi:hypothetical protein
MKKTDVAMIIFVASISMLLSYFLVRTVLGEVYSGSATVQTIDKIDPDIAEPDPKIFNENAINPAIPVEITGTDVPDGGDGTGDSDDDTGEE